MDKLDEESEKIKKIEEEGLKSVYKYFDRIHDKLFALNNIMIAAYFALSKLDDSFQAWWFILPILNMIQLLWVEYRMMEIGRLEANFSTIAIKDHSKHGSMINANNLISLWTIICTLAVVLIFLYFLIL